MKRLTVSLPDDLAERIRQAAGEGQVSAYVGKALAEYLERESLDQILADWERETPVDDETRRRVAAEFDAIGLTAMDGADARRAG